ncbi:hypothetical protein PSEUDO8BK_31079 [Pseudomonas sp. 8BK]|nr:hypothetical protein PSEUDO8BK_31079 [Pseudomonas sp. 8BK]
MARIGGDEFVVILENLPLSRPLSEEARNIGEKILAALTVPLSVAGRQQQIGASLGIAAYPDHGASLDKLIHIADLAMYEAKRSGENQYRMGANSPKHVHSK